MDGIPGKILFFIKQSKKKYVIKEGGIVKEWGKGGGRGREKRKERLQMERRRSVKNVLRKRA